MVSQINIVQKMLEQIIKKMKFDIYRSQSS